jgi:hypothetical protein
MKNEIFKYSSLLKRNIIKNKINKLILFLIVMFGYSSYSFSVPSSDGYYPNSHIKTELFFGEYTGFTQIDVEGGGIYYFTLTVRDIDSFIMTYVKSHISPVDGSEIAVDGQIVLNVHCGKVYVGAGFVSLSECIINGYPESTILPVLGDTVNSVNVGFTGLVDLEGVSLDSIGLNSVTVTKFKN